MAMKTGSHFDGEGGAEAVSINLSPMIDMVFILLIFFVVTANVGAKEAGGVRLPGARHARALSAGRIDVELGRDGVLTHGGRKLGLEALEALLIRHGAATGAQPELLLRADADADNTHLMSVLESATQVGAHTSLVAMDMR